MTTITAGRWLLVALAIVGLALVAPLVTAHGTDTTTDHPYTGPDAPPSNGTAAEWEVWMESHMTDHMGPGSVAWMEAHMGVTVEDMAQYMADGNGTVHGIGYGMHGAGYGMHGTSHGVYETTTRADAGVHDETHRTDTHSFAGHGC